MKKYLYEAIQLFTILGLVFSGKYINIDNVLLWFLIVLTALELWKISYDIKRKNEIERK